jgi:hypothetical protein
VVPRFHSGQPVDLKKQFTAALKELYGEVIPEPPADFQAFLKERFPDAKTICSAVPEYTGNSKPEDFPRWSDASKIDVTMVRSPLGSKPAQSCRKIIPRQYHRFLPTTSCPLDPADIVKTSMTYGHPHFQDKAYSLLMSVSARRHWRNYGIQPKG